MNTYRIMVRYDGARYKGWQRLGKDGGGDTIQSKLEAVFATLCGEEVLVTGSGRTDAGVHAIGQTAHFRCAAGLRPEEILGHANRYLPDDIAVTDAAAADERFHARYNVVEKHYLYRLDIGPWPDPFQRKYTWHIPESLDFGAMRRAADFFVGEHDFAAFTSMKSKKKPTVRVLQALDILEPGDAGSADTGDPLGSPLAAGRTALIRLKAGGFLQSMARIIVGTLVEIGKGERNPDSVAALLENGTRAEAGARAPAKGLFLERAVYG